VKRALLAITYCGLAACSDPSGKSGTPGTPVARLWAGETTLSGQTTSVVGLGGDGEYEISDGFGTDGGCGGATAFIGACCFIPPAPVVDAGAGQMSPPACNPDGGPNVVLLDLGTLTFSDSTSNETLGTDTYGPIVLELGCGSAEGYQNSESNTNWSAGDTLLAKGVGGDAESFSVSARAVSMPGLTPPSSISRSAGLTLSWTPDPNATTLQISLHAETALASHGGIVCNVSNSAGTTTVDASLLSNFETGDSVYMFASNETTATTQTQVGTVAFEVSAGFYAVGSVTP
jgi:hypothetical protein